MKTWVVCRDGVPEAGFPNVEVAQAFIRGVLASFEKDGAVGAIPCFTIVKREGETLVAPPTAWERILREPAF